MCHCCLLLTEPNVVDSDFGKILTMSCLAAVILATLPLEDRDLLVSAMADNLTGNGGA
jgi:hypothetical protein